MEHKDMVMSNRATSSLEESGIQVMVDEVVASFLVAIFSLDVIFETIVPLVVVFDLTLRSVEEGYSDGNFVSLEDK